MLLPCLCTSFQWDPACKTGPQSGTLKIHKSYDVIQPPSGERPVPLWSSTKKIQSITLKSKGSIQSDPAKGEMDY